MKSFLLLRLLHRLQGPEGRAQAAVLLAVASVCWGLALPVSNRLLSAADQLPIPQMPIETFLSLPEGQLDDRRPADRSDYQGICNVPFPIAPQHNEGPSS